ncbi:MAG: hypothetical protein FWD13_03435, partial [Treponema sp.]|nr:hypothetical protein [Treponema sp.]
EWVTFRNKIIALCKKASIYYQECQQICIDDQKEAKKRYAMFVLEKYKPVSSFLFEAIRENAELDTLFNKIEYKEFKRFWIPTVESLGE